MQRRMMARSLAACTLAAAVAVEGIALAQEASTQGAAAEALFRDAQRLMLAGTLDEACPKFVAAQKLDPTVGTALNLGDCFERAGKTASAWASFNEARRLATRQSDSGRAAEAARRATRLEASLTRLLLTAPSRGLPAGIEIQLDDQPLDAAVIGTAIPVDPGTHTVVVKRADARSSTTVTAPPGQLTVMVELTSPVARAASVAPPASGWGTPRIVGVSIGVVGVAGVVVGSIFGVQAISGKAADGHCDELTQSGRCLAGTCCKPVTCEQLGYQCGTLSDDGCGQTLLCDDQVMNGTETSIDCGGKLDGGALACPRCPLGRSCNVGGAIAARASASTASAATRHAPPPARPAAPPVFAPICRSPASASVHSPAGHVMAAGLARSGMDILVPRIPTSA